MLHTLDDSGKLFGYTQKSCDQAMKEEGVGKSVVNDLINPIIRWNLGQNSDNVSGLTGKKKNIHIVNFKTFNTFRDLTSLQLTLYESFLLKKKSCPL